MSRRATVFAAAALGACATTSGRPGTVERLYVLEVGATSTTDVSPWSGTDAGTPWTFAIHCYLIRHRDGWLLWDTGPADRIAELADGLVLANGAVHVRVTHPLADWLREIGIAPRDVTHLALSHFHLDHAGNANAFAGAVLYVQQLEHDAAFGPEPERFGYRPADYERLRGSRTVVLRGDHDVFGDGSVVLLATPGHTPGHQSLLVRLRHAGPVLLAGDVAHLRSNWEHRRAPASNFDRAQSLRSMERVGGLLRAHGATLVLPHDAAQGRTLPKPPGFLD